MRGFLRQHVFSFLVIAGAVVAYLNPAPFVELAGFKMSRLIVPFIQIIMFGMGTTLGLANFVTVLKRPWPVVVGVVLQFSVMPCLGCGLAMAAGLDGEIAAGVVLIGSAAGGVASNVMAYIAGANVALSVSMTMVSTLAAPLMTPLLMRLLAGRFVEIDMLDMALSLVNMIIIPLFVSQLARAAFDRWCRKANDVIALLLPYLSMTAICIIVTICTAAAHEELRTAGLLVFAVAIVHNGLGYTLGYWGGRLFGRIVRIDESDCRTIAIEVGMQNAGMSQALALNVMKSAGAALAPAIFGVWMDFSGSLLAGWWRKRIIGRSFGAETESPANVYDTGRIKKED